MADDLFWWTGWLFWAAFGATFTLAAVVAALVGVLWVYCRAKEYAWEYLVVVRLRQIYGTSPATIANAMCRANRNVDISPEDKDKFRRWLIAVVGASEDTWLAHEQEWNVSEEDK